MRLDEQIRWLCVKPCHCDHLLSHETVVVEYQGKDGDLDLDRISWSRWSGSVIIEVDIHERPCSTGVSKSECKINVRWDNQSGTLMTLKNFAGFYYVSLFLGLITSCCSGKWAFTHCPHPTPWPERAIRGGSKTEPERQQKLSPVWPQFWWLSHWMGMFNKYLLLA